MLSGGVILPRERLHEPAYSVVFEGGDKRLLLLQAVLSKMVCPLTARVADMGEVLTHVARIETWTQEASLLPISSGALAGIESLQRNAIAKQFAIKSGKATREQRLQAVEAVKKGALTWLEAELQKAFALIKQSSGLSGGVRSLSGQNDVPHLGHYMPGASVELWVQSEHDPFRREHILRFSFCLKHTTRFMVHVGPGPFPTPEEPDDVEVGTLPAYGQVTPGTSSRMKTTWEFFDSNGRLHQPATPQTPGTAVLARGRRAPPIQPPKPTEVQLVTFLTSMWPNAADVFPDAFKRAFDVFVTILNKELYGSL